jgi:CPA2 family monovalent cation:H+ antiporter-2
LSESQLFANRELTVLLSIAVGFGAAWAAHALQISPALGAFVAGMLLGESPFATQVRADIGAMRIIMVTLFFASVGMQAKPIWFLYHLHWIVLAGLLILLLKTGIIFLVARIFGLDSRQALAAGITLSQVGEFSFVLAATASSGGVLDSDSVDLIVSVIIVLMLATPYLIAHADTLSDKFWRLFPGGKAIVHDDSRAESSETANQVLVVGLGPAGRQVVQMLLNHQLEPILLDVNPKSREYARQLGLQLHIGDAGHEEILMHAGLARVCLVVVTVPDPRAAIRIVSIVRRLRPQMTIAVRCRYHRHMADLTKAGADIVVDGEITMGNELSKQIVERLMDDSGVLGACRLVQPLADN